jgi:PAS domain S-box-containing protein
LDDEKQDLKLVSHKGLSKKFINRSMYFSKNSAQVKIVLNNKPFYSLYKELSEISGKDAQEENIKLLVVIPLTHNQKVIGSLNVASKTKEELSDIEKKEIESLSSRIGNLIVYAKTQERLKIHQKELERKIEERTKVLRESNNKLNEEIKFHKKTKIALAESEQKYRGIFENAQDGIVLYDAETLQLVEVNKKAYESLGYTFAEFKNLRYDEFTIHKYKNERKELIEQLLLKGNITFQAKHRKKNGEISHRIVNASVLTINDKKYIQGAIHDISDIIEKELALQKSEKRYKDLQSNIPIGIWTTNLEGKFLYINKAVKKMLGLDPKRKAINLSVTDIYYNSSERSEFVKQIQRTGYIKNKEMQFLRKDKSVFWGKVSANAVFDDDQKLMWIDGVVEDITEKKEAQLKLLKAHHEIKLINRNLKKKIKDAFEEEKQQHQYMIQKSKIESLGELAAGIAHEINQPLGVMSLSMENLQMKISSNRATAGYLQNKFKSIESNINRIRKIVDHIRTFSYESSSNSLQKVNINKGISNALLLIGTQYQNHNINIKLDLQENIGFTIGSNQKFEQVVLNLLSNAKYAVEECATNYCESEYSKNITIKTCATEKKISVSVEDNGIGIKSEYLTKVFDPFFTSKPEGIGTGLGLSIVYGIIKEMRGEIVIDSEWNKFTKVKISFPRFPENS